MTIPASSDPSQAGIKPVLHLRKAGSASGDYVPETPPVLALPHEPPPRVSPGHSAGRASLGWAGYTKPAAWVLGLALGALTAGMRYGGVFHLRYEMTLYGPWIILVLHLIIVVLAFKEDLFTGVLCLAIPGYSLYYLVAQSGRPFFTALVFGLLAGMGEDAYYALCDRSRNYYDTITDLISGSRRK